MNNFSFISEKTWDSTLVMNNGAEFQARRFFIKVLADDREISGRCLGLNGDSDVEGTVWYCYGTAGDGTELVQYGDIFPGTMEWNISGNKLRMEFTDAGLDDAIPQFYLDDLAIDPSNVVEFYCDINAMDDSVEMRFRYVVGEQVVGGFLTSAIVPQIQTIQFF